jgi:hypothetical protein
MCGTNHEMFIPTAASVGACALRGKINFLRAEADEPIAMRQSTPQPVNCMRTVSVRVRGGRVGLGASRRVGGKIKG